MRLGLLAACVVPFLLACDAGEAVPSSTPPRASPDFTPGQVWAYATRPGEDASTLTIGKVDHVTALGRDITIVHVSIDGVRVKNARAPSGFIERLPHLPIERDALAGCVTKLLGQGPVLPDFGEGYAVWSENHGGVFTVPVSELVDLAENGLSR